MKVMSDQVGGHMRAWAEFALLLVTLELSTEDLGNPAAQAVDGLVPSVYVKGDGGAMLDAMERVGGMSITVAQDHFIEVNNTYVGALAWGITCQV